MQLTSHTDYSLRLLIYLAVHEEKSLIRVQDVAAAYHISMHHMAKVAQTMTQLGYIHSYRGRKGGVALAMPAQQINIGALVRQTENLQLLECFGPNSQCVIDPACRLKHLLGQAQEAFLQVLDGYCLSDALGDCDVLRLLLASA